MIIPITLQPQQTGLTLAAQLVDAAGVDYGSEITAGFAEIGNGFYQLETAVEVGFAGGIKVYEAGTPGTILAYTGIEQVPSSQRAIIEGEVQPGTHTLTTIITDLPSLIPNAYNGSVIIFYTGQMPGTKASVSGFNPNDGTLTVSALPQVPQAGDLFVLV